MRKIAVLILLLIYSVNSFAKKKSSEEQVYTAKFRIVKATIKFVSTDTKSYPNIGKLNLDTVSGYTSLKNVVRTNEMGKLLLESIDNWRNTQVDTDENAKKSLIAFIDKIVKEITTNDKANKDRSNRVNLRSYTQYESDLKSILDGVKILSSGEEERVKPATSETIPSDTSKHKPPPPPLPPPPAQTDYVPYIVAGVFLILAIFAFLSQFQLKGKYNELNAELTSLKEQKKMSNERQNQQVSSLRDELDDAKSRIDQLRADLINAEAQTRVMQKPHNQAQISTQVPQVADSGNVAMASTSVPVQFSAKKYAIYADQADGFSASELHDSGSNDTVFEIGIKTPITAEYRIYNNSFAHKTALADPSMFLSKACVYESSPTRNSIIKTDVPGQLKLQGGKWQIISPAKISFT